MRHRAALSAVLLCAALATPVAAQENAGEDAARAAFALREATGRLEEALTKDDQVTALTEMIDAYETGLASLRAGLRQAGIREQEIRAKWEARRDQLSSIIGVMMSMETSPETLMLLHPAGPEATARSGMILSSVVPGLREQADALKANLDDIAEVRVLQEDAANTLAEGLGRVQEARRLLASAVTDRSTMPKRFAENPEELQALEKSAATLDAFAEGIADMESDVGPPLADFDGAQGSLPLPVQGKVLRRYGEADAAGIERPGLVIATAPASLVTAPWPATIRYRGPLLDYGNVTILEPAKDYLLILAGMAQVFGEVGDVLAAGEPVGLMGGTEPPAQEFGIEFVVNAATGGDADRTETLYLELRRDKETLDPAEWFVLNHIVEDGPGEAEAQAETE
ncbi:Septal ring factor EnvC, activator of murein hydrolases AmiA and AmiB [Paracoccus isoporae]|uniref:Septal ring factor EnvC, activator of murein hydrolases AmiA and AmiB n=1 Tax=Paracoccus isoporae TaxID=591205 RepID=A0A1G6T8D0_9RHOB|nr:peptidoglycan DD-metalloendopeptidase family protein [Paracoccus isoporae]SDD25253.1 Septal ring factor EnvC, activator of murein hydrolases AmiA and AmiB [Paracoccus isoporae]